RDHHHQTPFPTRRSSDLQFYDRRDDPASRKTRVTLARSIDGGKTFTNYAWSDDPFEAQNAFLGDYEWLTARDGRVYGVWTEEGVDRKSTRLNSSHVAISY